MSSKKTSCSTSNQLLTKLHKNLRSPEHTIQTIGDSCCWLGAKIAPRAKSGTPSSTAFNWLIGTNSKTTSRTEPQILLRRNTRLHRFCLWLTLNSARNGYGTLYRYLPAQLLLAFWLLPLLPPLQKKSKSSLRRNANTQDSKHRWFLFLMLPLSGAIHTTKVETAVNISSSNCSAKFLR